MFEKFERIFKWGLTNFKRNSWLSIGTTGVMVLALFIFISLVSFNVLSETVIKEIEEKVDVTAYFKYEATEDQILKIQEDLKKLPEVKYVDYTSRAKALEDFKKKHINDSLIQEAILELNDNPLQASLNIKANGPANYASILNFLESNKFRSLIDKIDFYENETAIKKIESISRNLRLGGILVTVGLSLIAVLITFNTIRLTIYSQKQEIEIMRLVGASNWYIRGPYLVEGALYGIFASFIVLIIFYPTLYFISPKISSFLSSLNLFSYFTKFFVQTFILVVGSGIFLGVISSFIAIRRYLKV